MRRHWSTFVLDSRPISCWVSAFAAFLAVGVLLLAVGQDTFGYDFLAIAPWLPFLIIQDYWRWVGFMAARPGRPWPRRHLRHRSNRLLWSSYRIRRPLIRSCYQRLGYRCRRRCGLRASPVFREARLPRGHDPTSSAVGREQMAGRDERGRVERLAGIRPDCGDFLGTGGIGWIKGSIESGYRTFAGVDHSREEVSASEASRG